MSQEEEPPRNELKLKKFSKKNTVYILIGLLFASSIFGVTLYSSAQNSQKAQDSFTLASEFFNESKINEAKKNLEDALALKPDNSDYLKFMTRIENAEKSLEGITNAKQLIDTGMLLEALEILSKINTSDLGMGTESKFLVQKIAPEILSENQIVIQRHIRSRQYSEAKEKLTVLISLFAGRQDVVDKLQKDYQLISELQKKQSEQALAKLSKRYDKFQDITWYTSPNSPRYRNYNAFYIYFGSSENSKLPLRLVVQYENDDWLFIRSAEVNVDGKNYSISGEWERDNDSRIWEWIDEKLDDREMIESIIKSRSAIIRFDGDQYYDTRTISSSQKRSMQDVLTAYDGDALG